MTGDYTIVQLKRQDELTRAIQERLANVRQRLSDEKDDSESAAPAPSASEAPPSLATAQPVTPVVQ
jgi:hypothetical protein